MRRIFRARDYRPRADADLDEELESHLELKVEDLVADGMGEEEARLEARRGLEAVRASSGRSRAAAHTRSRLRRQGFRDRWGTLARDLRYALRRMARSPGFTLIAILSLAIAIGANTAVFSVVNGLFLRPPPYSEPQELVQVWTGLPDARPSSDTSWEEFEGLLEVEGVFAGVGAFDGVFTALRDGEGTRSAFVEPMTPNLFPMLGIEPVLGRSFLPDEGTDPAGNPLAILGYDYWMQAFGGDRGVLGQTIQISGIDHTVVGVAPSQLSALQTRTIVTEAFVPMSMARFISGDTGPDGAPLERPRSVKILARLVPNVTLEAAEARVSGVVREVRDAAGLTTREGWGFRLWPLQGQAMEPDIDAGLAKVAVFLMVVAGLVLMLACTNLANLFLARGVVRKKELALRRALGAGRGRLTGQLFTEAAPLSILGGLGGFFLAQWTLDLLFRFQPDIGIRFALDTSADLKVLFFTFGLVGLAAFLFGLFPALAVTRSEVATVLKGGAGPRRSGGHGVRSSLVALQMAVSVLLLAGSSLFFQSLLRAEKVDLGFRPENTVALELDLGRSAIPASQWASKTEELRRLAASMPGIEALGVSDIIPLGSRNTVTVGLPGQDIPERQSRPWASQYRIDEGYLDAMGISVLSGRGIQESDREGTEEVVLVSQAAVRRFWPEESPWGRRSLPTGGASEWWAWWRTPRWSS